jgi:PAS domain S-box-containing protein
VLYVEHHRADIDRTRAHLAGVAPHLRVEAVPSAAAALARLHEGDVDLVLADLRLPDTTALELLQEARRRALDAPFLVVTGGGDEATAATALELGAYDYLVKRDDYLTRLPYSIDQVIARHQLARANRELHRELDERHHLQQVTAQTLALLEALQKHAPIGIAFMDDECRFQRVNDELAAINGLPAAAHVGRTIADVLPGISGHLEPLCRRALGGVPVSKVEINGTTPASPGEVRYFNVSLYPIRDVGQAVVGVGLAVAEITERKRAEAALREHAAVMADMARQKDEFLAMLGHELRNPLAPIRTALDLLHRVGATDEVSRNAHEVIGRQTTHMVRLLDDLLDVSRITSGRVTLCIESVNVHRIVADAVDTVRPLIAARRHRLETFVEAGPLIVEGDLTRLVQVLVNLLNNAAKYTDEEGTIRLSVTSEGGCAVLRVADSGAGISERLLPKIFDLFTQDERALDRAQGGLGVGLTLVKRITELHNGTVEAYSGGRGHGSTFTIRLPLHSPRGAVSPLTPPVLRVPSRSMRCLVVEDNIDAARMLELALSLEGHQVRVAFDGRDAVDLAADFQPDAIVLDIGLPRMNGYDVARAVRALPGLSRVFIVGVTGYGQAADYGQSQEAGFDAHLVKPIEIETLLNALAAGEDGSLR